MTSFLLYTILLMQPAPPPPQDEAAQTAEAKAHFERGKELFKSGAYDQAIQEFKQADQIKPSPILAYNIGLAYEKLGRCKAAIGFFQRYLREQPEADNRADTESKIGEQQGRLSRGECAGQRVGQVTPGPGPGPEPGPGPGPGFGGPPPSDTTPIGGEMAGTHPVAIGLRFGPIFGGLGTLDQANAMGFALGKTTGFHLRAGVQFPLLMLPDGRAILQGELFGALVRYGFNQGQLNMVLTDGDAKIAMGGFDLRGNIYVSRRVPIAITPALGFGLAGQLFNLSLQDGSCDISINIPAVVVNLDLAARFELAGHHAFYFSPANLYIITPGLSDGGVVGACIGNFTGEQVLGTDKTKVNYSIDFGYMFQF
jgi:hypothetical protein